jgi:hypothetical protein
MLDDLTMKHVQAHAVEGSSSNLAPSQESSSRPFTRWIRDSPNEK